MLCDLGLPGLDGYGVAAELKKRSVLRTARLVAVTAYDDAESRNRTAAAGFAHHLAKPADAAEPLRLVSDK